MLATGLCIMGKEEKSAKPYSPRQFKSSGLNVDIVNTDPKYHLSYDISPNGSRYIPQSYDYINYRSEDFQYLFRDVAKNDVLCSYEYYKYPAFREYASTLPEYNNFIKALHEAIKTDKKFRKLTHHIPGFESSFGFRSSKSGFQDFIAAECERIERLETGLQLNGYNIRDCIDDWSTRNRCAGGNEKLEARLAAIDRLCKGNGNALREQLHSEVSEIESRVTELEKNYSHDRYVKILTPLVRACTAQAIKETCPIFAFQLTDFSYAVTDVLFQSMEVLYEASFCVAKGVGKGISTVATVEHWKNMVTGTIELADLCIRTLVEGEMMEAEYGAARFSTDPDAIMKFAEKHCLKNQQEREAFNAMATESYNRLKAMSWQELVENGSEVGTTMILDTFILNAIGAGASSANKAFITKVSSLTEGGVIFTEQYAAEVAGFGKLMMEEGPQCATKINDAIKKELISCIDGQSAAQQAKRVVCPQKWAEETAHTIRNVGPDILDVMEKSGGHGLEFHVGQTHSDLLKRAVSSKKSDTISTFNSKSTAIKAVQENLKNNSDEIVAWLLSNPEANAKKTFTYLHDYAIGRGIIKAKKNSLVSLNASKLVLIPDPKNVLGFKIKTFFPTK